MSKYLPSIRDLFPGWEAFRKAFIELKVRVASVEGELARQAEKQAQYETLALSLEKQLQNLVNRMDKGQADREELREQYMELIQKISDLQAESNRVRIDQTRGMKEIHGDIQRILSFTQNPFSPFVKTIFQFLSRLLFNLVGIGLTVGTAVGIYTGKFPAQGTGANLPWMTGVGGFLLLIAVNPGLLKGFSQLVFSLVSLMGAVKGVFPGRKITGPQEVRKDE